MAQFDYLLELPTVAAALWPQTRGYAAFDRNAGASHPERLGVLDPLRSPLLFENREASNTERVRYRRAFRVVITLEVGLPSRYAR